MPNNTGAPRYNAALDFIVLYEATMPLARLVEMMRSVGFTEHEIQVALQMYLHTR